MVISSGILTAAIAIVAVVEIALVAFTTITGKGQRILTIANLIIAVVALVIILSLLAHELITGIAASFAFIFILAILFVICLVSGIVVGLVNKTPKKAKETK